MSKNINTYGTVQIKGSNITHRNCVLCGRKLTEGEFYSCYNMCGSCRRKSFDNRNADYVDKYGDNKIDEILISKFGKKGKES